MENIKILRKIFIALFMVGIMMPSTLLIMGYDFQSDENRALSEKPVFNWQTMNKYPEEFTAYYEDNMPFKNLLVKCNAFISVNLFQVSSEEAVILGKNGWLFYDSKYRENTDTLEDYLNYKSISQNDLKACKNCLLAMRQCCEKNDAQFVFMLAPNKMTVYGDQFMPDIYRRKNTVTKADVLVEYLQKNTDLTIVYPKNELLRHKDDAQIYRKLDTHWNELGAYIGYRELYYALFDNILPDIDKISYDIDVIQTGDLQRMLKIETMEDIRYNVEYRSDINVERYQTENGFCCVSDNQQGNKVLMFRDSYATAMEKYITKDFTQTYLNYSTVFDERLVVEEKPDIVIFQIVERSVFNIPSTGHFFYINAYETHDYNKENAPQYSSEEVTGYCEAEQNENILKVNGFSFVVGRESESTEAAIVLIGQDVSYEAPISLKYRPDVEEVYNTYNGIGYSGIEAELNLKNIKEGSYDVYIILKNNGICYYHNVRYCFEK